jgi:transposase
VEMVSRDRAGASAEGIRQGAPQATQVADRFHLRKNVTEALEHFLTRQHAALRQAERPAESSAAGPQAAEGPPEQGRATLERRNRRRARYDAVVALRAQGCGSTTIAKRVGMSERTVWRWLQAGAFPERRRRTERPTALAPLVPYLRERWAQGCYNATLMWNLLSTSSQC